MELQLSSSHESRATTRLRGLMLSRRPRRSGLLLIILIVLCWVPTMTSATFWTSMSYVAGESMTRKAKRHQQQQQSVSQSPQTTKNDNGPRQQKQEQEVPSTTPRMADTSTTELKRKQGVQEEVVHQQQTKDCQGQEAYSTGGDVPPVEDTAATFILQKVQQLATNKAKTTVSALSEPTTLDSTVPVSSASSSSDNGKNASADSSPTSNIKEKQQLQQTKVVSPAGITRYILVSAVLALSLLNIHLYISL